MPNPDDRFTSRRPACAGVGAVCIIVNLLIIGIAFALHALGVW